MMMGRGYWAGPIPAVGELWTVVGLAGVSFALQASERLVRFLAKCQKNNIRVPSRRRPAAITAGRPPRSAQPAVRRGAPSRPKKPPLPRRRYRIPAAPPSVEQLLPLAASLPGAADPAQQRHRPELRGRPVHRQVATTPSSSLLPPSSLTHPLLPLASSVCSIFVPDFCMG